MYLVSSSEIKSVDFSCILTDGSSFSLSQLCSNGGISLLISFSNGESEYLVISGYLFTVEEGPNSLVLRSFDESLTIFNQYSISVPSRCILTPGISYDEGSNRLLFALFDPTSCQLFEDTTVHSFENNIKPLCSSATAASP